MGGCCIKIEPAANVIAADIDLNYVANISIQQRVLIGSQNEHLSVESSVCHVVVDEKGWNILMQVIVDLAPPTHHTPPLTNPNLIPPLGNAGLTQPPLGNVGLAI